MQADVSFNFKNPCKSGIQFPICMDFADQKLREIKPAVVAFRAGVDILHRGICRFYQHLYGEDGHVGRIHIFTDSQLI